MDSHQHGQLNGLQSEIPTGLVKPSVNESVSSSQIETRAPSTDVLHAFSSFSSMVCPVIYPMQVYRHVICGAVKKHSEPLANIPNRLECRVRGDPYTP